MFPNKFGKLVLPPFGYGRDMRERWWWRPPGEDVQPILAEVIEHADETITVAFGRWSLISGNWGGFNAVGLLERTG